MLRLRTLTGMAIGLVLAWTAAICQAADKLHVIMVQSPTVAGSDMDVLSIGFVSSIYNDLSGTEGGNAFVLQEKQGGNRQRIFEAIEEIAPQVGPKDAVLFYYSGHGATDQKGHFLALDDRTQLHRDELRQKLRNLGGRLTIIVTDCCAVLTQPAPPTAAPPEEDEAIRRRFLRNMTKLLSASGVVDMNSCSQGEVAWGTKKGGLFTVQFARTLFMEEVADWKALTRKVTDTTMASYRDFRGRNINSGGRADGLGQAELRMLRNQAQQQPQVFVMQLGGVGMPPPDSDPAPPADPPPAAAGEGVLVAKVNPNTTATSLWLGRTQMKLEVGDRVLAINGQAIGSAEQFGEVIDGLERGATFDLLIIDGNSKKQMKLRGQLDVGGKYRFGITVQDR